MELREALEKVKAALDVLEGTNRKAGCSDKVFRTIVSAQINGIMASGVPEAISIAIEEIDRQAQGTRGRTAKKQDKELNEDG